MAIISPLKKIFNWQTASEKIPYKVYSAYITVDDNEEMYAIKVLENTVGNVTFKKDSTGYWFIELPYAVPRLNIMIPGFGDFWSNNNSIFTPNSTTKSLTIYPGFGVNGAYTTGSQNLLTDRVEVYVQEAFSGVTWRDFWNSPLTGPATAYPIEIRVYN